MSYMGYKGWPAEEIPGIMIPAQNLWREISAPAQRSPEIYPLWAYYTVRGEIDNARDLAGEMLSFSKSNVPTELSMFGHSCSMMTAYFAGDFDIQKKHSEKAISGNDPDLDLKMLLQIGHDPHTLSLAYDSHLLWIQGHPRTARGGHR